MITLGVDFAAQPERTAACRVAWRARSAQVEALELGVDDARLRELAADVDRVGLDVPFGWPDGFVEAITMHKTFQGWPLEDVRSLRFRRTDLFVQQATGRWPLSVSTDRIGITAMRAARLLADERDRTGGGRFIEVYPAASRLRFGITSPGDLQNAAPWLSLSDEALESCSAHDHCFDAVVAALTARAAAIGLCEPIPETDREAAEHEGWIALPFKEALPQLVKGVP